MGQVCCRMLPYAGKILFQTILDPNRIIFWSCFVLKITNATLKVCRSGLQDSNISVLIAPNNETKITIYLTIFGCSYLSIRRRIAISLRALRGTPSSVNFILIFFRATKLLPSLRSLALHDRRVTYVRKTNRPTISYKTKSTEYKYSVMILAV